MSSSRRRACPREGGGGDPRTFPQGCVGSGLRLLEQSFRLPASYFSLLVQRKVTKRKHLPRQVAQGVWVAKEFSDSASCLGPKTAAIHGRRPFGVSGCWRLLRDCESQGAESGSSDCAPSHGLDSQPLTFSILRMRPASRHPEGGRHGCRPFSDRAMDGESENGDDPTHPLSGFDLTRKVLSFGYFSLHQQRKVTRRRRKLCS